MRLFSKKDKRTQKTLRNDMLKKAAFAALLSALLTFISLSYDVLLFFGDIKAGHKSDKRIIATKDYFLVDNAGYQKKIERVKKTLPHIFDYDSGIFESREELLSEVFLNMRNWSRKYKYEKYHYDRQVISEGKALFEAGLELSAYPEEHFIIMWSYGFSERTEGFIKQLYANVMKKGYTESAYDPKRRITLRTLADYGEESRENQTIITGKDRLRAYLLGSINKDVPPYKKNINVFVEFVVQYTTPNVFFNPLETEKRENEILKKISPSYFVVKKGETILGKGEIVLPATFEKIRAIYHEESKRLSLGSLFNYFFVYLLICFLVFWVSSSSIKKFLSDFKSVVFTSAISFMTILFVVIFLVFGTHLSSNYEFYPYVIVILAPMALTGLLVRLFLNFETSVVVLLFTSIVITIIFRNNIVVPIYFLLSSLLGAHLIRYFYTRGAILRSGIKIGIANVLIIILLILGFDELEMFMGINKFLLIFSAAASGLLSAILLIVITPFLEYVFNFTTNIKLLELSNLDHPLLKELMIKAPGTYNHSVLLGNLVEAAAQAIRVNPLLARVSAYYHDIGKVKMPEMFVENQQSGHNKHEDLAPNMSFLIVSSHVKEGVELAQQHELGEQIINAISQHHGTRLVTYFYAKALKLDPNIKEESFRYSGSKPQTREIALIMMADAVEAACRVLDDPSSSRLNNLVKKIIQDIYLDGQLDECELTMKDLNIIVESFTRTLMGIYHQRIDYPDIKAVKENDNNKKTT